ncbi:TPA: transcriptional repressor NrdR [Candidatus Woesearchaeota archaeon]|nr:transcriptional repressor NrdR [Candidatus Woesearchaeota archaeon]
MYCPFCSHSETRVLESRIADDALRRRRECEKCSARFTTYEKAVFSLTVIKKDGREQPFQIEKIRNSVVKSLGKGEEESITAITQKIEHKILAKKTNSIKTTDIGKVVMQELKRVDKMAYLRFATIHKSIEDPKLLRKELEIIT